MRKPRNFQHSSFQAVSLKKSSEGPIRLAQDMRFMAGLLNKCVAWWKPSYCTSVIVLRKGVYPRASVVRPARPLILGFVQG